MLSDVISLEMCYEKFCYSWDKQYQTFRHAKKCQPPYWDLEIYNNDMVLEVKRFIISKQLKDNYPVPLGMTCEGRFCRWRKMNIGKSIWINRNNFLF